MASIASSVVPLPTLEVLAMMGSSSGQDTPSRDQMNGVGLIWAGERSVCSYASEIKPLM